MPVSMEIPKASSIKAFCATDVLGDWVTGANAEAEATMVAIMAAVFMMRIVSIFGVCLRYRYRRRLSVAMLAKAKAKSGASEADGVIWIWVQDF